MTDTNDTPTPEAQDLAEEYVAPKFPKELIGTDRPKEIQLLFDIRDDVKAAFLAGYEAGEQSARVRRLAEIEAVREAIAKFGKGG